jgi:hypothetical protein
LGAALQVDGGNEVTVVAGLKHQKEKRGMANLAGSPRFLTAAERIQYEGYLRREETNAAILGLSKSGMAIRQIARHILPRGSA